ncbi:MAG TPA: diguanylate cyclase [Candidatus Sumerlaeota bacterium]|nr:diguanylate cyclase [Candidatus Sumerlaeota bacterium]
MRILNHAVYIHAPQENCTTFVDKLAQEGFSCDLLPADNDLMVRIRNLEPAIVLLSAELGRATIGKLTENVKEWLPDVPVLLVLQHAEAPPDVPDFSAADGICYSSMPSVHLALLLRGVVRSSFKIQKLAHVNQKLNEISITDALTGLHNRGYMIDRLNQEFKRAGRNHEVLSCLMIDLDHFKQVNDTYGHKFGDVVLQTVASRLKSLIRETDVFGRYGGEEFLLLLPNCNARDAQQLAEKLRSGLEREPVTHEYFSLMVTASFGVASTENSEVITSDHLLQHSDRALYRAKETGRNRVCVITDPDPSHRKTHPELASASVPSHERMLIDVVSAAPDGGPCVQMLAQFREYETALHASEEDFLQAFREREPQVILLDQISPGIDGQALCRHLKAHVQDLFIPILLFVSDPDVLNLESAHSDGVFEILTANLPERDFLARLRSMLYLKSLYDRWRVTYRDLTMARTRLVKAERLTALGEMATGVAHDFNNILSAILGRTQLIRQRIDQPDILKSLSVIEQAAMDGATTIRRIQEFARSTTDQADYQGLDMAVIVHDCIQMTRTRWKDEAELQGISYRFRTDFPGPLPVTGNPAELREVITNLLMNALDAMARGGEMWFRGLILDNEVILEVQDSGEGMEEAVLKRIFDPFFSTKEGEGTGLGLSVSYGIVSRHGGRIECSSKKGEGTVFRITLPLREEPLPEEKTEAWLHESQTHAGETNLARSIRVLVVDDEAPIREIFHEVLTSETHTVLVAESGEEALQILSREPIDLVFTDLSMPGMSGWEVSMRIHQMYPDLPIVLTSGWGADFNLERLRAHGVSYVLAKPVPFLSITALVHHVAQGNRLTLEDTF